MFLEDTKKNRNPGEGWIEVICGSMFSGKTEELLRRLKRARIARQEIQIFKPEVDKRYHPNDVVSHDQNIANSLPVQNAAQILNLVGNAQVIAIDEAQFFDDQLPDVCNQLANEGYRVIVAGLDMDFSGRPFGPMPQLLAMAEYVTKVHAICVRTGRLAQFSHRIADGDSQIILGQAEHYEPLSRKAFLEARREREKKER